MEREGKRRKEKERETENGLKISVTFITTHSLVSDDAMLSQFFILTPRGDTIVAKDYRGDVVRGPSSPFLSLSLPLSSTLLSYTLSPLKLSLSFSLCVHRNL
jgi:hypothetical protein